MFVGNRNDDNVSVPQKSQNAKSQGVKFWYLTSFLFHNLMGENLEYEFFSGAKSESKLSL